jgi:hypothetical protein
MNHPHFCLSDFFAPGIAPSLAISVPELTLVSIVAPSTTATFAVVSTASTDFKAVTTLSAVVYHLQQQLPLHLQLERFLTLSCASVSCTPLLPRTVEMVAIPSPSIPTNDWIAGKLLVVLTYFLFLNLNYYLNLNFLYLKARKLCSRHLEEYQWSQLAFI